MTMEKNARNIIEGYKKYTGSELRVHKPLEPQEQLLSKSDLEHPNNINKYRSFVGQLMWYTTKVGPDMANTARELVVHMINPGP